MATMLLHKICPKSLLTAIENGNSEIVNIVLGILIEIRSEYKVRHETWDVDSWC